MKPYAMFDLSINYKSWNKFVWFKRNQGLSNSDIALPIMMPIWSDPAAFNYEALSAKHFSGALMMNMHGILIPPEVRERYI